MIMQNLPAWVQIVLVFAPAFIAASAAVGLLINVQQFRALNAQARASIVADCLKGFAADGDMQNAYYSIEYSSLKFDDGFPNSPRERDMDKLLRHFANIALAWQARLLSVHDVRPLEYYILRITRHAEVQKYVEFVIDFSKQVSPNEHPYAVLDKLGNELIKTARHRRPRLR